MVIAPVRGSGPPDVVAWAHGTVGIVEACAPSLSKDALAAIPRLQEMVDHGWVIVATDYPGPGTRGPDGYLVGAAAVFMLVSRYATDCIERADESDWPLIAAQPHRCREECGGDRQPDPHTRADQELAQRQQCQLMMHRGVSRHWEGNSFPAASNAGP